MTQTELAERAGLSRSVIARLETGAASISSDRLWVLAAALGTKPSRLLAAAEADGEAAATLEQPSYTPACPSTNWRNVT